MTGTSSGEEDTEVTTQESFTNVLLIRVTAPYLASNCPLMSAPFSAVIEVWARILPLKSESPPRVAEEPTCQKTLQAWAPFMRIILLFCIVTRVDADLNIKTASGSIAASRVKVPEICISPRL